MGTLGASKLAWCVDWVTRELHERGNNSVCIIIQSNRANDEAPKL